MTTYQVKFQRTGFEDMHSDPFRTLHAAQTFAAINEHEGGVTIVELDDYGKETRTHPLSKF
jgi:hypothetical protein